MENESRVTPVLGHLAWLLDRIDAPVNANRLRDAALLTYNAAAGRVSLEQCEHVSLDGSFGVAFAEIWSTFTPAI